MPGLLVWGDIRVDYLISLDRWPQPGKTSSIGGEIKRPAGAGACCAMALAEWSGDVVLQAPGVGTDYHGSFLLEKLNKTTGLECQVPAVAGIATGYAVILTAPESAGCTLLQEPSTHRAQQPAAGGGCGPPCPAPCLPAATRTATFDATGTPKPWLDGLAGHGEVSLVAEVAAIERPSPQLHTAIINTSVLESEAFLPSLARELSASWNCTVILHSGFSRGYWSSKGQASVAWDTGDKTVDRFEPGMNHLFRAAVALGCHEGWATAETVHFASRAASLARGFLRGEANLPTRGDIAAVASSGAV